MKPHGVLLSNGPGDPQAVGYAVDTVRTLLGKLPLFGICLGHQILGLALGAHSYKLKFGHRGVNHPVADRKSGKVRITSQNHGFALDPESLRHLDVEVTETSLNDQTVEGLRHLSLPVFSVQYHPEAAPGPHDNDAHFDQFLRLAAAESGLSLETVGAAAGGRHGRGVRTSSPSWFWAPGPSSSVRPVSLITPAHRPVGRYAKKVYESFSSTAIRHQS